MWVRWEGTHQQLKSRSPKNPAVTAQAPEQQRDASLFCAGSACQIAVIPGQAKPQLPATWAVFHSGVKLRQPEGVCWQDRSHDWKSNHGLDLPFRFPRLCWLESSYSAQGGSAILRTPRDGDPWGHLRSCRLHPLALGGMQDLPVISVTLELMATAVPES